MLLTPDNFQALTHLAALCPNIDVGTAAVILPWNNPLRVAEKALVLDKQGHVKDTLDNLVIILRHDEALQHIAFNCHRDGIDAKDGLPWEQMNPEILKELQKL